MSTLLQWRPLRTHPRHEVPSVERVVVRITTSDAGCALHARFEGGLDHIVLPEFPLDPERLWEHTCLELFVSRGGGAGYVEWNFSPTGQVTRFDFASYRQRTGWARDSPVDVSVVRSARAVELVAAGPLSLADAKAASITAVVRNRAGQCAYWALAHPAAQPDFHDPAGFVLDGTLLSCTG